MSMPECEEGAVFNLNGETFRVKEAHYNEDADMATLVLSRVVPAQPDLDEVDKSWLGRLAWVYVRDLRRGGPIPWETIEIHTGAPTPCILFCHG